MISRFLNSLIYKSINRYVETKNLHSGRLIRARRIFVHTKNKPLHNEVFPYWTECIEFLYPFGKAWIIGYNQELRLCLSLLLVEERMFLIMNSLHYSKQSPPFTVNFKAKFSSILFDIHANCQTSSSSPLNSNYDNPLMSLNCPLQKKNSSQLQNVSNSFKKKMFRDRQASI